MSKTLILQSHRLPLPHQWLGPCMDSVKSWAGQNRYEYRYLDDELFGYVPDTLLEKTKSQRVIATDLARLKAMQSYLAQGFETLIWCDADFLIFAPDQFTIPDEPFALGREVWVQETDTKPGVFIKVHNAFMMYRKGNVFLDFYADTAERLLTQNEGSMPPQFIGPKLLTAIHNVVQCPVLETAGMLSPLVIKDIVNGEGPALKLFQQRSTQTCAAVNLCSSSVERNEISAEEMKQCIDVLLENKHLSFDSNEFNSTD